MATHRAATAPPGVRTADRESGRGDVSDAVASGDRLRARRGAGLRADLRTGVAAATLAVATPLLRSTLLAPRGGSAFLHRGSALAATMTAGGLAGGALDRTRWQVTDGDELRERVLVPLATAAGAVAVFAVGASVVVRVPVLLEEVETVMAHATRGSFAQATTLAVVTGATEELFFRGTVHDVAGSLGLPRVPATTAVYAATTGAAGNPLLVLAAGLLGVLTGRERERTDSLLAPTLVHVGWSLGMLATLPRITERQRARQLAKAARKVGVR